MKTIDDIKSKYLGDDNAATRQSLAAVNEFDKLLDGVEKIAQNIVKVAVPQMQRVPVTKKPQLVDKLRKLFGKLTSAYIDLGSVR